MESTHDRETIHARDRNTKATPKAANLLYKEKESFKHQFDHQLNSTQSIYQKGCKNLFDKNFDNFKPISPSTGHLIAVDKSAFSPIKSKKEEDESVVSSTTNETRAEKPLLNSIEPSITYKATEQLPEEFQTGQQLVNRLNTITETAVASSTTTIGDDEECLEMLEKPNKGRRPDLQNVERRPPSCGTVLEVIKERQPSSTTQEDATKYNRTSNSNNNYKDEFLKPLDVAANNKQNRSSRVHSQFYGDPVEGANTDDGRIMGSITSNTTNGFHPKDHRYQFDPRQISSNLNQVLNRSPIQSDVSLIPMSPQQFQGIVGSNQLNPNSSLDFYMGGFSSPTMSVLSQARNLSPRHSIQDFEKLNQTLYGPSFGMNQVPPGSQGYMASFPNGFPPQSVNPFAYIAMQQQQQKILAMSLEKSDEFGRFPSPLCRSRARKRPLSISPAFSDGLDINAMIRTSPNSLLPYVNGPGLGHSRCSSAASGGSLGHLAAGGLSPSGYLSGYTTPTLAPPHLQLFSRQMPGFMPGVQAGQLGRALEKIDPTIPNPFHSMTGSQRSYQPPPGFRIAEKNSNSSVLHVNNRNKNLGDFPGDSANQSTPYKNTSSNNNNLGVSSTITDDNEAIYVTNCEWENCDKEFDTQEQLVQHINNDHIHGDKKEFACHWKDCAREKRPFKAQYMLVVHMRRHTGEKPHKCTFKGCTKAYSRLENLKTHLRSHTGEKPYVCEYPNCTKAFSNASDRAKHQNRTHSSEKPYVCKIAGCTKRYTDPSSLRKHVKTVHGPEAHVTKRMKATREREERKSEINVKQEPGVDKDKKKPDNDSSKQNCNVSSLSINNQSNDSNQHGSMNPRSNQSSYTSGSDVTPQNSPHMTSQNNDSGVDVNVGGNDVDSDGDIVVDENPLPDSTSGGLALQSRRRGKSSMVPKHFNKKMATLSLEGSFRDMDGGLGEYSSQNLDGTFVLNEKNIKQGSGTEVSSTTLNSKLQRVKNYIMNNSVVKHRQMALINQDRRDSGTGSDVSRKSSSASQMSRKSSKVSSVGINVAGSYDPISLDPSRRSSSNSVTQGMMYQKSSSNPSGLNEFDLHHLQSKFSEVAGLPPPTPINGEPSSRYNSRSNENSHLIPNQSRGMALPNRPGTFLPTPPRGSSMRTVPSTRTRSVDIDIGSHRPHSKMYSQSIRRASDPVPKASQIDPQKLPTVQRHDSWSNITPLPSIQSRNNDFVNHHQAGNCEQTMQTTQQSNSVGNVVAHNNMISTHQQQQQHHLEAKYNHLPSNPHACVSDQTLLNNIPSNAASGSQHGTERFYRNQNRYGNAMSPGNVMSPSSNMLMSPSAVSSHNIAPSPRRNDVVQPMINFDSQYAPITHHNTVHHFNQPMVNLHVSAPAQHQHDFYDNGNMPMNPEFVYGQGTVQHPFFQQQFYLNPQRMPMSEHNHYPSGNINYMQYGDGYNQYYQQMQHTQENTAKFDLRNQDKAMQQTVPPTSLQQGSNSGFSNSTAPIESNLTPRPPSHGSSSTSTKLRLARLRQNGNLSIQPNPTAAGSLGSYGRPIPRVNYTPDAQIPDDFLQQEFIDSIPALQPDNINISNGNEHPSFVKMPADSTTGPDGDIGEENDDAMSMTNTDVTLPPMSAFSSRLATPLMNKPYPPQHPFTGTGQHPASNMAISSMSSMLSTLEEENKYLNLIPPQ